jgi:hypothetical protein
LRLRRDHPVFRSQETEVELNARQGQAGRTLRLSHPDMDVVIAGNFGLEPRNVSAEFQGAGWWYDFFGRDSLLVSDLSVSLPLLPGEFTLYTSDRVSWPAPDLVTVQVGSEVLPEQPIFLNTPYPNPFREETTLRFTLGSAGHVSLDVFDALGRRVVQVVNETLPTGTHTTRMDATSLPAGCYIARLTAGDRTVTRALIRVP